MSYRYLSYAINEQTPVYGGGKIFSAEMVKSIRRGDSANTFRLNLSNHTGTHIDAPNHFFNKGKKISEYKADFWIFRSPAVINVKLKPKEMLTPKHLSKKRITLKNDILLIRSGWFAKRSTKDYIINNPGIHPETAEFLRENFPGLRALGIDWISVSSFANREIGRQTHKLFLNPDGCGKPILLLEDMDLTAKLNTLREVFAFPMRIAAIDSAPCTVIGRFK